MQEGGKRARKRERKREREKEREYQSSVSQDKIKICSEAQRKHTAHTCIIHTSVMKEREIENQNSMYGNKINIHFHCFSAQSKHTVYICIYPEHKRYRASEQHVKEQEQDMLSVHTASTQGSLETVTRTNNYPMVLSGKQHYVYITHIYTLQTTQSVHMPGLGFGSMLFPFQDPNHLAWFYQ